MAGEARLAPNDPNIVDRITFFLFRKSIVASYRLAYNCVAFVCRDRKDGHRFYLKFSYSGNIQYHEVHSADADKFLKFFNLMSEDSDATDRRSS
jgi:hypothetical protein